MDDLQVKAALMGAAVLAPPMSKHPKRAPVTVDLMKCICSKLNLSDPLDAAVASCLTMTFYSVSCTGEFTVLTLTAFDPTRHIKLSDISVKRDCNNLEVMVFHLPKTKCATEGEDVFWSRQDGITDLKALLKNHLRVNNPPPNGHLFAYRHRKSFRPLTKRSFLERINTVAAALGEDGLKGHGIRIGGTLEFLLHGVPFDVMKSLGRWLSDTFSLYLRQHAIIIAPYIQDHPILEEFTQYTMPRVRNR